MGEKDVTAVSLRGWDARTDVAGDMGNGTVPNGVQRSVIDRDGDDMPSYSVTVFEADGREHQLTAYSGSEIVGFSEIYKLVREKFEQK